MVKDTRKIIQALAYLAGKEDDKVMDNMKALASPSSVATRPFMRA